VERAYRHSTRVLGLAICLLGVVMVVLAVTRGGGPFSLGVLIGLAFAGLGAGRAYLAGHPAEAPPPRR
jgi:hypothetical protein